MNRAYFKHMLSEVPDTVDKESCDALMEKCIAAQGDELTIIRSIEELAELTVELSKVLRHLEDRDSLLEELADAAFCIEILRICLGISDADLHRAVNVKLEQAKNRL